MSARELQGRRGLRPLDLRVGKSRRSENRRDLRLLVNWITNPVQSEAGSVDPASHRAIAAAHSLATGWVLACIGPGREIPEQFYRGTGGDSFAPDLDAVDAAFQLRFRNSVPIPGE